ncbi:MAG: hypothetical protein V3U33_06625, partial [candidate division NC10 bacterium]
MRPTGGRGEVGLDPAEPWFAGGQGEPPTGMQWRWGMAVLLQERTAPRGSTRFRHTDLWNCSAGEDLLAESSRARV